ncbi:MAG: hypothetical protein KC505_06880 [Myxococcales bacterium]|nr:hypothetical protein [Myxococcales bacterium]USN51325.1 MAG: hypothetical protein H6731_02655 [Myxococcales bacterium]
MFQKTLKFTIFLLSMLSFHTAADEIFELNKRLEIKINPSILEDLNEKIAEFWTIEAYPIDDYGQINGRKFYGRSDKNGIAHINIDSEYLASPFVIKAINEIYFDDQKHEQAQYEIFLPAHSQEKFITIDATADALWQYYKEAANLMGQSFSPSLVDQYKFGSNDDTWFNNLKKIREHKIMREALQSIKASAKFHLDRSTIEQLFQKNPSLLQPTRFPHAFTDEMGYQAYEFTKGDELFDYSFLLDDYQYNKNKDSDPIVIDRNGMPNEICGHQFYTNLEVNGRNVFIDNHYNLDSKDFIGTIHESRKENHSLQTDIINVRHSNGISPIDNPAFDDACSLTTIAHFQNQQESDYKLDQGSGFLFHNFLIHKGSILSIYQTSNGDKILNDKDSWAIFTIAKDGITQYAVIVELLGIRQGDFRDALHMKITGDQKTDLFIGLRKSFKLNEAEIDGESAYLKFDISVLDYSDLEKKLRSKKDVTSCLLSLDELERQMVSKNIFLPEADLAQSALMIARSQCFSATQKQQSFNTTDARYWSISNNHGVYPNVLINTGWLPPKTEVEIFVEKWHDSIFKGPRMVGYTDEYGQLFLSIPTIVEGDRLLLKPLPNKGYDLVIPVVAWNKD